MAKRAYSKDNDREVNATRYELENWKEDPNVAQHERKWESISELGGNYFYD